MKNLEIQTLLRLHGLQHVVDYLKLVVKEEGDLVLLKYKQIEADWSIKALHDCRGIILDKSKDWKVVAFPYEKFFNIGEGYCAEIDWSTAKFYEKADGSLINMYFYNGKWNVQTSGTIYAESFANNGITTFADLVWKSVEFVYGSKDVFISKLNTDYNYMFELCTPENIVVTPHADYTLELHGIRDMKTFNYVDIDTVDLMKVFRYNLSSVDDMLSKFDNMTWMEEGFVVCDANYNRAKCKNPKYVAVHHVSTGVSPYSIINVIKTNEMDEFLAYFKHRADEVNFLKTEWDKVVKYLTEEYNKVKDIENDKEFALEVFSSGMAKDYTGVMFSLRNGKTKNVHDAMCKMHFGDNGYWYNKFYKNNINGI